MGHDSVITEDSCHPFWGLQGHTICIGLSAFNSFYSEGVCLFIHLALSLKWSGSQVWFHTRNFPENITNIPPIQLSLKEPSRQEKYFVKDWPQDMHSCCRFYKAHAELGRAVKSFGSRLLCLTITFTSTPIKSSWYTLCHYVICLHSERGTKEPHETLWFICGRKSVQYLTQRPIFV